MAPDRDTQIRQILEFVRRHRESHASRIVCSRVLGRYHMEISSESLSALKQGLEEADEDEVSALYYLVT